MEKRDRTAAELEEEVRQRIGAGDYSIAVQRHPETGWLVKIHGREPAEVHRCQVMADTITTELSQHYDLKS